MACASLRRLPSTTITGSDAAPARHSTTADSTIAQNMRVPTGFAPFHHEQTCDRMASSSVIVPLAKRRKHDAFLHVRGHSGGAVFSYREPVPLRWKMLWKRGRANPRSTKLLLDIEPNGTIPGLVVRVGIEVSQFIGDRTMSDAFDGELLADAN